ncbi:hypothetical protein [Rothia amarae]|uniref:hypothetical protein n=1 Tax=Rothia amarae TaxID=169480 RepID=UPI0031DC71B1
MTPDLSRRSLAKGAAWAAPIVAASATIPAYASSKPRYSISASWFGRLVYSQSASCGTNQRQVSNMGLWTNARAGGTAAAGFAVPPVENAPQTTVTLSNIRQQVAFPAGLVSSITVTSGSWANPTVVRNQNINNDGYLWDIFTFNWIGSNTGQSSDRSVPWANSPMTTTMNWNNTTCFNQDVFYRRYFWARLLGSYTTANGFSYTIPTNWLQTPLASA